MPTSPTLLILAAGMGSRYGGLKQIEAVGPQGEAILEYSIFDALRAGFGNVVCVIRREIELEVRSFLETRLPPSVRVDYACQELEDLPQGFLMPAERQTQKPKPWGTGHAVLAAERLIENSFLMINADDFYGRESFSLAFRFLAEESAMHDYAIVGYPLSSTLSAHGSVSRAICRTDKNQFLQEIVEQKNIFGRDDLMLAELDGTQKDVLQDTLVSMNMIAFRPSIFAQLRRGFFKFLETSSSDPQAEFQLPDVLKQAVAAGQVRIKVLPTTATWFGITYREDRQMVEENIRRLVTLGEYPSPLW